MYENIMVDLETLGIKENAVILSVGAVKFNHTDDDTWETITIPDRCFYETIDTTEQITGLLRVVEPATADWWDKQSPEAKAAVFNHPEICVLDFIEAFSHFCKDAKYLWANGVGFDCNKLRHLYDQTSKPFPFKYNADMDIRTARLILSPTREVEPHKDHVAHNALSDAVIQALRLQSWVREKRQWLKDPKPGSAIQ